MPMPNGQLASFEGQSLAVRQLHAQEAEQLEEIKQAILAELADLRHGKSIYDQHFPWWAKHIFGDASYAHEAVKKSLRAASLVSAGAIDGAANQYIDAMDDTLMDLLNFTVMWMAWRRYQRKEQQDADVSHSTGLEY
jgi:hypothetical protein